MLKITSAAKLGEITVLKDTPRNLVVAPHHDDEVIGCGGTIALLTTNGNPVDVVYMTAGYSGIRNVAGKSEATSMREQEAKQAGSILGIGQQVFLRYPDRELEYSFQSVKQLIKLIRKNSYQNIYCPHASERDREHRITYEITREAFWLANSEYLPELGKRASINRVFTYEVWTPLQQVFFKQDISNLWQLKLKALFAYRSQFTRRQAEGILGLNRYRAAMSSEAILAIEAFGLCLR